MHQELARTVRDSFTAYVLKKSPRYRGMYTLRSWRSHLSSVEVDILHQEPASTVGDPFEAYVPGEVTQILRMTDVQTKFLEKSPR